MPIYQAARSCTPTLTYQDPLSSLKDSKRDKIDKHYYMVWYGQVMVIYNVVLLLTTRGFGRQRSFGGINMRNTLYLVKKY